MSPEGLKVLKQTEKEIVSIITSKKGATEHIFSLDIIAWRPSDYVKQKLF